MIPTPDPNLPVTVISPTVTRDLPPCDPTTLPPDEPFTVPHDGAIAEQGPEMPVIPGYVVTGEIARGGMGRVLAGRELALDREVAIKTLLPKANPSRFLTESKITAKLPHPNIPPVYALGTLDDGSPFLAMKFIRGETLAAKLADRETPASDLLRFLQIFEQIAQAVGFAHSRGVIHRDLKPLNVMVGEFGEVQVMDWGLAREARNGERGMRNEDNSSADVSPIPHPTLLTPQLTSAGAVMGTPAYMAPEQARGEAADARADVFALGAVLMEILTGERPWGDGGTDVLLGRAGHGLIQSAWESLGESRADADLIAVAKRCLQPNAAERYANARELATAVAEYRAGVEQRLKQAETARAEAVVREAEQRRRRKVQLALAASVLLLAVGASAFAWWQNEQSRAKTEQRARNADALGALVPQCEAFLRGDDPDKAGIALVEIDKRMAEGGGDECAERVARCHADYRLLRELDRIDESRWEVKVQDESRALADRSAVREWENLFDTFGIRPGTAPPEHIAGVLGASSVRERLLIALDYCLRLAPSAALREALFAADPDPFRNEVRGALLLESRERLEALASQPEALNQPGHFAVVLGTSVQLGESEAVLQSAVQRYPSSHHLLLSLAKLYAEGPASADARIRWFQAALAIRPSRAATWNDLGLALAESGDTGGAIRCYRESLRRNPTSSIPHHNLGLALAAEEKPEEAVPSFREAIRLDRSFSNPHNGLGASLRKLGKRDEAIDSFREAAKLDPTFPLPHLNLGRALQDKGDYERAIAEFREAIRLAPKRFGYRLDLAEALENRGDLSGAIAECREAARIAPFSDEPHVWLGLVLRRAGDLRGAIASYREAIRWAPRDASHHLNLSDVLIEHGDFGAASDECRHAIHLHPNSSTYHCQLGYALFRDGKVGQAIPAFRTALRLRKDYALAHAYLSDALIAAGDFSAARSSIRDAVALNPTDPYALNEIAWRSAIGRAVLPEGTRAVDLARRACELTKWQEPDFIGTLGAAHADGKNFEQAIKYQQLALTFPTYQHRHGEKAKQRLELYFRKQPYREIIYELAPAPRPAK